MINKGHLDKAKEEFFSKNEKVGAEVKKVNVNNYTEPEIKTTLNTLYIETIESYHTLTLLMKIIK